MIVFVSLSLSGCLGTIVDGRLNTVEKPPPHIVPAAVTAFHNSLFVSDLHADSLLMERDLLADNAVGHVDVPRLLRGNVSLQVFSIVSRVPRPGAGFRFAEQNFDMLSPLAALQMWPSETWFSAKGRALYQIQKMHDAVQRSQGRLLLIRKRSEFESFRASVGNQRRVASMLSLEGGHPFEGELANIDLFYQQGVRLVGPMHLYDNALGDSSTGVDVDRGLSSQGQSMVRRMFQLGMVLDLAHSSDRSFAQILQIADAVGGHVFVSHTGSRTLADPERHPKCGGHRHLSDTQAQEIAKRGGIIGLGLWQRALCETRMERFVALAKHFDGLPGVDSHHLAIGSDYDGSVHVLFDVSGMALITHALLQAGFEEHAVANIMGESSSHFFARALPE